MALNLRIGAGTDVSLDFQIVTQCHFQFHHYYIVKILWAMQEREADEQCSNQAADGVVLQAPCLTMGVEGFAEEENGSLQMREIECGSELVNYGSRKLGALKEILFLFGKSAWHAIHRTHRSWFCQT